MIPAWFKPTVSFPVDGKTWIGTGAIVFRAVDPIPDGLKSPNGEALIKGHIADAGSASFTRPPPIKGYVDLDGAIFQGHFLDVCEAAHPGIEWRPTVRARDVMPNGYDCRPAVGFVGGDAVAVVMPTKTDLSDEDLSPVGPPCPKCDGEGKIGECATCDGSGTHECECGDEHDCGDCNGEGYDEDCADCGGSGIVSTPAA